MMMLTRAANQCTRILRVDNHRGALFAALLPQSADGNHSTLVNRPRTTGFSTTSTPVNSAVNHEPPLPIRMALVSTTTALATPSFPALGFLYAVLRLTVPDANLRNAMEGRWGTLLSFTTWTVLPTLYHGSVASLILPCALSNAVVAGGIYGLIDVVSGGPTGQMKRFYNTPLLGAGIGASVGYIAPHYMYGPAMELYGIDGMTQSISYILSAPLLTEISVVTGAVAGTILHPLLYYPIHSISGVDWRHFSGLALAASAVSVIYLYYGRETVGLPVPEGSFISTKQLERAVAVLRYNQSTDKVETYSLQSGRFIGSQQQIFEGRRIAEAARLYSKNGNVVFDDRLLSFIYNYWDVSLKSKYADHVIDLKSTDELNKIQDSLAVTDAIVTLLTNRDGNCKSGTKRAAKFDNATIERTLLLQANSNRRRKQFNPALLEETSAAIELLMTLKNTANKSNTESLLQSELEEFIDKTCPNVILYVAEEMCPGVSIESQLKVFGWESPPSGAALARWDQLCKERSHQMTKRIGFFTVAACVFLSILASASR